MSTRTRDQTYDQKLDRIYIGEIWNNNCEIKMNVNMRGIKTMFIIGLLCGLMLTSSIWDCMQVEGSQLQTLKTEVNQSKGPIAEKGGANELYPRCCGIRIA